MEDAMKQIANKYWTDWSMLQSGYHKTIIDEEGNSHDLREELEAYLKENFIGYDFVHVDLGYQRTKELYIVSYVDESDLIVRTNVFKLINPDY